MMRLLSLSRCWDMFLILCFEWCKIIYKWTIIKQKSWVLFVKEFLSLYFCQSHCLLATLPLHSLLIKSVRDLGVFSWQSYSNTLSAFIEQHIWNWDRSHLLLLFLLVYQCILQKIWKVHNTVAWISLQLRIHIYFLSLF